ncbi:YbfB/YjiJ family MFS transporter [Mesorhizobium sp. B2-3-4]|uniref:YbfB/YjiJ family MFS transporter n=1 Tax=Mesorhizobium sp. B2-3-4 TaxID=2589959 RepID=UPI0015E28CAF|nr:YbfB/YjiJ family MFS transporter [Mesorhizobium sp. B2-3-4]
MALDIGVARLTYGAVLPGLSRDLHLSFTSAGVLSAVNLAGYLIGTLMAPRLGTVLGMPRLAFAGHLVVAVGAALTGLAIEPIGLGVGRVLMGLGAGVGLVALFVMVFAATASHARPLVSTVIWSGIGLALVLTGILLPHALGVGEWRYAFLLAAAVGVAISAGLWRAAGSGGTVSSQSNVVAGDVVAGGGTLRWAPLFAAYFMFGVAYIAYSTFAGARLASSGAPIAIIAMSWVVLGAATIAGCALTALVLSSIVIRKLALGGALLCGAVGALLVGFQGTFYPLLASVFVGLGLASTPAIVTAYVRQRTDDAAYARLFSLATASLGVGQLLGPVLGGVLADRYGSSAITIFAATCYAVGTVFALVDAATDRRAVRS